MPTPTELSDIATAMHNITRPASPLPAGELRDAVGEVLTVTVQHHRRIPETEESVAMCSCGDEWVCAEVTAVRALAQVITRQTEDEAARANNGWRI
jgi:hypothetical protein